MPVRLSYFEPALPLLIGFGVVALARAWRHSTKGKKPWLLTISIVGMLMLSTNVVAWLFALPLEGRYSHDALPREDADAIVILSGNVHHPTKNRPYSLLAQDTFQRLQHGVWLFKHWRPLPILVSGGPVDGYEPYAAPMKRALESEGIPDDGIWVEDRSRSTRENAVYSARILRQHQIARVALIVEANSMPRAAAVFRKEGITVIPAPIRFTELDYDLTDIVPNWRATALNDETLHEYVGLVWYWLYGWI
jgi:uncharacterized SAM-binding protein YcdF (DUF218 family)